MTESLSLVLVGMAGVTLDFEDAWDEGAGVSVCVAAAVVGL